MKPEVIFPCRTDKKKLEDKITKDSMDYRVHIDYCTFDLDGKKSEGSDDVDVSTLEVSDDSSMYVRGTRCFDVTTNDVYIFMYDSIESQNNLYDRTVITFWKYEAKSWTFEIYKTTENKTGAAGSYEALPRDDITGSKRSTLTFKITNRTSPTYLTCNRSDGTCVRRTVII